ncbi:SatD family protein [Aerococcus urinaeequi]|uniref:SatD family protein n=1 Tax=Aerococcus sp. HMSC10H05 TaxID=1581084 RepID=UPI0008A5063C|nr:SatD family protein [Aerococcus sp. HMSC10H05]OFU52027.1 SatD protein [Aerococcus sp. HMSC10H05]
MDKSYIAIIGDLIDSKKTAHRAQLQENLIQSFYVINQKYAHIIVSKLTITLGDEFQVLIKPNEQLFQFIDDIQRLINHPIRFGIGYGNISTEINPEMSIGADGSAYWHARAAIEEVASNNYSGNLRQVFIGLGEKDTTINTILLLTDTLRSSWTRNQLDVFNGLLEEGIYQPVFNQSVLAKKLNLSASALSKRLNAGNIKIYLKAKENLINMIEEVDDVHS